MSVCGGEASLNSLSSQRSTQHSLFSMPFDAHHDTSARHDRHDRHEKSEMPNAYKLNKETHDSREIGDIIRSRAIACIIDHKKLSPNRTQTGEITLLGSGGFGQVYMGTLNVSEGGDYLPVALKVCRTNDMKQVMEEARYHPNGPHPNILRMYGVSIVKLNVKAVDQSSCIVMEYCNGGDLYSNISDAKSGKLFVERYPRSICRCSITKSCV